MKTSIMKWLKSKSKSNNIFLKSKDIKREELGAAYLTFFFKAKLTQTGLSCAIELFNITSPIQLPASFDCLINIINFN
jgi:hypothetical protein